jgi:peptidyl-prolyl cis-trans isomerase A (cyclophilin A)
MEITVENLGFGKGLYAIFETSLGKLVARLEEERTPETVKNFVGLATGEKEYIDPRSGKKGSGPYYDGTNFHRIIKNFMVQGGDPTGTGTGGPGFRFKDECRSELSHKGPGILSMANAGPGTNGSQFFITLVSTPWLDGRHTVFGELVSGLDVLTKMGEVATGPMDRPREELKLISVKIIRES